MPRQNLKKAGTVTRTKPYIHPALVTLHASYLQYVNSPRLTRSQEKPVCLITTTYIQKKNLKDSVHKGTPETRVYVHVFQTGNARALFTLRERLISDRRLPGADVTRLCPTKLSPVFSRYFSYRARLSTSAASGVPRHHATSSRVERGGTLCHRPRRIPPPKCQSPTKERKTKTRITCTAAAACRSTRAAHICI